MLTVPGGQGDRSAYVPPVNSSPTIVKERSHPPRQGYVNADFARVKWLNQSGLGLAERRAWFLYAHSGACC